MARNEAAAQNGNCSATVLEVKPRWPLVQDAVAKRHGPGLPRSERGVAYAWRRRAQPSGICPVGTDGCESYGWRGSAGWRSWCSRTRNRTHGGTTIPDVAQVRIPVLPQHQNLCSQTVRFGGFRPVIDTNIGQRGVGSQTVKEVGAGRNRQYRCESSSSVSRAGPANPPNLHSADRQATQTRGTGTVRLEQGIWIRLMCPWACSRHTSWIATAVCSVPIPIGQNVQISSVGSVNRTSILNQQSRRS